MGHPLSSLFFVECFYTRTDPFGTSAKLIEISVTFTRGPGRPPLLKVMKFEFVQVRGGRAQTV